MIAVKSSCGTELVGDVVLLMPANVTLVIGSTPCGKVTGGYGSGKTKPTLRVAVAAPALLPCCVESAPAGIVFT
ncbi:MAG: hypothetical protein BWX64_01270 [Acidobacteria bacterium ADurb.Bin051]|nr:MAG: hypothetical protein BWX64_01270 [Acidobacteria bacterium ADurb.Bin051]